MGQGNENCTFYAFDPERRLYYTIEIHHIIQWYLPRSLTIAWGPFNILELIETDDGRHPCKILMMSKILPVDCKSGRGCDCEATQALGCPRTRCIRNGRYNNKNAENTSNARAGM